MTDEKKTKHRRLSHEILGMIGISALVALVLFGILVHVAAIVAENYCFQNDISMTEFDWIELERWIFGVGAILAVCAFSIVFLSLLRDRMAYIRTITQGIEALRAGQEDMALPLEGHDELTQLAQTINEMSLARRQLRQREQALAGEKDQLIRALSHDIRTPLTSILAYSEYLAGEDGLPAAEQKAHLHLIQRKAQQIRELTDILLDGGKRSLEPFENARLLMEQLAAEFESELEDQFRLETDLSGCDSFRGNFDVQELRRIFDNLASNVRKYADPARPVHLQICLEAEKLRICQKNAVLQPLPQSESYRIGLNSIRRIAQHYGGSVRLEQTATDFEITVTLSEF